MLLIIVKSNIYLSLIILKFIILILIWLNKMSLLNRTLNGTGLYHINYICNTSFKLSLQKWETSTHSDQMVVTFWISLTWHSRYSASPIIRYYQVKTSKWFWITCVLSHSDLHLCVCLWFLQKSKYLINYFVCNTEIQFERLI